MAKNSEPALIDRIREVHPKYAALLEKQRELLDRQAAAQAEANPLGQEERRALLGWVTQQPKPKPKPIVRHAGAVDLVGELLKPMKGKGGEKCNGAGCKAWRPCTVVGGSVEDSFNHRFVVIIRGPEDDVVAEVRRPTPSTEPFG